MSAFDFPQWVKAEQAKSPQQPRSTTGEVVVPITVAQTQQQPKRPGRPKGSKNRS